jgi:hypothetical protein
LENQPAMQEMWKEWEQESVATPVVALMAS